MYHDNFPTNRIIINSTTLVLDLTSRICLGPRSLIEDLLQIALICFPLPVLQESLVLVVLSSSYDFSQEIGTLRVITSSCPILLLSIIMY